MLAHSDPISPEAAARVLQQDRARQSGEYHLTNIGRRFALRRADLSAADPQLASDLETLLKTLHIPIPAFPAGEADPA